MHPPACCTVAAFKGPRTPRMERGLWPCARRKVRLYFRFACSDQGGHEGGREALGPSVRLRRGVRHRGVQNVPHRVAREASRSAAAAAPRPATGRPGGARLQRAAAAVRTGGGAARAAPSHATSNASSSSRHLRQCCRQCCRPKLIQCRRGGCAGGVSSGASRHHHPMLWAHLAAGHHKAR